MKSHDKPAVPAKAKAASAPKSVETRQTPPQDDFWARIPEPKSSHAEAEKDRQESVSLPGH